MAEKDIPGGGNRRIKDSMFVDLFGKDMSAKENFLSLYNALHGTDLRLEDTKLEPEMIDGAVYMSYANDVAMMVNGQVVDAYGNPIAGCSLNADGYVVDAYWNVIDPNTGLPI